MKEIRSIVDEESKENNTLVKQYDLIESSASVLDESISSFNMEALEALEMMSNSFFNSLLNEKSGKIEVLNDGTKKIELFEGLFLNIPGNITEIFDKLSTIETHEDFEALTINKDENGNIEIQRLPEELLPSKDKTLNLNVDYLQTTCSPEAELIRILEIESVAERLEHFKYLRNMGVIRLISPDDLHKYGDNRVQQNIEGTELRIINNNESALKNILQKDWMKYSAKKSVKQSDRFEKGLQEKNIKNYFYSHNHPDIFYDQNFNDNDFSNESSLSRIEKADQYRQKAYYALRRVIIGSDINYARTITLDKQSFKLMGIIIDKNGYSINISYINNKNQEIFRVLHLEKGENGESIKITEIPNHKYLINAFQGKYKGILRSIEYLEIEWYNAISNGCIVPVMDLLSSIQVFGKDLSAMVQRNNYPNLLSMEESILTLKKYMSIIERFIGDIEDIKQEVSAELIILKTELNKLIKSL
jgi:hypothetical protein